MTERDELKLLAEYYKTFIKNGRVSIVSDTEEQAIEIMQKLIRFDKGRLKGDRVAFSIVNKTIGEE